MTEDRLKAVLSLSVALTAFRFMLYVLWGGSIWDVAAVTADGEAITNTLIAWFVASATIGAVFVAILGTWETFMQEWQDRPQKGGSAGSSKVPLAVKDSRRLQVPPEIDINALQSVGEGDSRRGRDRSISEWAYNKARAWARKHALEPPFDVDC